MQPPVAIIETAVYAEDLFAAETFYREVLGFDVIAREEGRHVFFRVGTRNVLLVFNPQAERITTTEVPSNQIETSESRQGGFFSAYLVLSVVVTCLAGARQAESL